MGKEAIEGGIPLAEVVQELREEIVRAVDAADAADEDLRFTLDKIQLELEVAVTKTGEGKTTASFWVLDFEAGGAVERSRTQKVVLELTPTRPDEPDKGSDGSDGAEQAKNQTVLLGRPVDP